MCKLNKRCKNELGHHVLEGNFNHSSNVVLQVLKGCERTLNTSRHVLLFIRKVQEICIYSYY